MSSVKIPHLQRVLQWSAQRWEKAPVPFSPCSHTECGSVEISCETAGVYYLCAQHGEVITANTISSK